MVLPHRLVRHRSAISLVREKLRDQISEVGEERASFDSIHDGPMSLSELHAAVLREGLWAFVRITNGSATIHWYTKRTTPLQRVAHMLGHELGHISGRHGSGLSEERRADRYGDVAVAVISLLKSFQAGT